VRRIHRPSADVPESSADGLQTLDGIRLSQWIATAPISRATAYQLLRLLGITPEKARVPGSRAEVSMLTTEQVAAMDAAAARIAAGATLTELATAIIPPGTCKGEPSTDDPQTDAPSPPPGLLERLTAADLAIRTGLPLSTREVAWLIGARPGGDRVQRGRIVATRHARGVWSLSVDTPG